MKKNAMYILNDERFTIEHGRCTADVIVNGMLNYEYDLDEHNLMTDFNIRVKIEELIFDGVAVSNECVIRDVESKLAEKLYFDDDSEDVSIVNEYILEEITEKSIEHFNYNHLDRTTIEKAIKWFSSVGIQASEEDGRVRVIVYGYDDEYIVDITNEEVQYRAELCEEMEFLDNEDKE